MYELSRIRLHSVGPKGARFQDVMIDLRDVGEPLARPAQGALFDTGDTTTTLRRPSPATVVFLENGGGKTVLMRLIFSVMLPGRRHVLGSVNSRTLEDYVLANDVAQVALEWQHTRTGDRVVTGKASEWRGGVVSADSTRLAELWYVFRCTAGLNLDTLPFKEDGRLVTLSGFKERLERANRAEPHAQAAYESNHRAWTEKLVNLDLDPELFRYQRLMNAGEGEAADAFTFRSDEAFIEFLLRAVTSDEDPSGLADVIIGYATKLAKRKDLLAERDFIDGALSRITPLAREAAEAAAAKELSEEARSKAQRLANALLARHDSDCASLASATAELDEVAKAENAADNDVRRLNEILLELKRRVAELRLKEAEKHQAELKKRREDLQVEIDAWAATSVGVELREANATQEYLRSLIDEQEERALPALKARDAAATALTRSLLHAMRSAEAEHRAAEQRATELEAAALAADREAQDAVSRREKSNAQAAATRREIEQVHADLRAAIEERILLSPQAIDEAAAQAAARASAATKTLREAYERSPLLTASRKAADAFVSECEGAKFAADNEAKAAAERLAAATARAEQLAAQPRLADLLGVKTFDPDADAESAIERLKEAVEAADRQRSELLAIQANDQRVLDALGDGGLLPANPSIAAALEVLEKTGITAWPGWTFVSRLRPEQRETAIRQHPLLADGIVLNRADQMPAARQVLTEARLVPPTIVAVGTTATLHDPGGAEPTDAGFIVPPNPALFDERAAEAERQRLTATCAERDDSIRRMEQQAGRDRQLAEQVKAWRADFPPGELARLSAARDHTASAAVEAARAAAAARDERDAAAEAEEALQASIPHLVEAKGRTQALADRLETLAHRAAGLPLLAAEEHAARSAAASAENDRLAAEQRAAGLRESATTERRRAGDHRRSFISVQEEISRIPGAGSVTDGPVPAEPLPELRSRYEVAAEAYRQVSVGDDLLAELRSAEAKVGQALSRWQRIPDHVRRRADALLYTPDGADAAGRSAASERLRAELATLGERIEQSLQRVGELRSIFKSFQRQDRALDPYGAPRDIAHGEGLIRRVDADAAKAREVLASLQNRQQALKAKVDQVTTTVAGFKAVLESLATLVPDTIGEPAEPFPLSIEEASAQRAEVVREVSDAQRLHNDAQRKARAAADALAQYAQDARFEVVRSSVRRQILAVERDNTPQYADTWEAALKPRLRTLNDDLAQISEHRSGIVSRLQGMVDNALRTLRQAQRLSKLPAALGDWAGQEFLRIRFDQIDPAALQERLGQVVDEIASTIRDDKQRQRIDGMTIVLKGVFAAMRKGVEVDMLKPDTVLRNERVRVAQVHDVFSGGQHLTAAIIIYCTMAALRANERGQATRPHAGVLFLDNPIGRASAGYLLDLQLAVARALRVQLVYTTGLFDLNALSAFPLIVRLRNDADLRAGLKYLSIDDAIRRPLAGIDQGPLDEHRVCATRLFVRPREATL